MKRTFTGEMSDGEVQSSGLASSVSQTNVEAGKDTPTETESIVNGVSPSSPHVDFELKGEDDSEDETITKDLQSSTEEADGHLKLSASLPSSPTETMSSPEEKPPRSRMWLDFGGFFGRKKEKIIQRSPSSPALLSYSDTAGTPVDARVTT